MYIVGVLSLFVLISCDDVICISFINKDFFLPSITGITEYNFVVATMMTIPMKTAVDGK